MALTRVQDWNDNNPRDRRAAGATMLAAKGLDSDDDVYLCEIDPATGKIPVLPGGLVPESWKGLTAAYPTSTQETYSFYSDEAKTQLITVVTVDYTDSTKDFVSSVTRS